MIEKNSVFDRKKKPSTPSHESRDRSVDSSRTCSKLACICTTVIVTSQILLGLYEARGRQGWSEGYFHGRLSRRATEPINMPCLEKKLSTDVVISGRRNEHLLSLPCSQQRKLVVCVLEAVAARRIASPIWSSELAFELLCKLFCISTMDCLLFKLHVFCLNIF